MSVFTLVVEGRFIGRFSAPDHPEYGVNKFHYMWCCTHCGSAYAQRVAAGVGAWVFLQDHCRHCRLEAGVARLAKYQTFRTPFEVTAGFAPVEILAEEFLFDMAAFAKELIDESSSHEGSGEPGELAASGGNGDASSLRPEGDPVR